MLLLLKNKNPHTQLTEYNSSLSSNALDDVKLVRTDTVHFLIQCIRLRLKLSSADCFGKHVYYPRQHALSPGFVSWSCQAGAPQNAVLGRDFVD